MGILRPAVTRGLLEDLLESARAVRPLAGAVTVCRGVPHYGLTHPRNRSFGSADEEGAVGREFAGRAFDSRDTRAAGNFGDIRGA